MIAMGVKVIETRPSPPNGPMRPEGVRGLPGCTLERGERIAIVAGAAEPSFGQMVGEWGCWLDDDPMGEIPNRDRWVIQSDRGQGYYDLPLGAVVCTVTVDDALPILGRDDELDVGWRHHIAPSHAHGLALWRTAKHVNMDTYWSVSPLADQLPLGDYEPGRWGWLMSNVQPIAPIPCKGRQGVFTLPDDVASQLAEPKETE